MVYSQSKGELKRKKAYSLETFIEDCKYHKEKIEFDSDALDDAINILHIYEGSNVEMQNQILDQIAMHNIDDFEYKNTKPFRKGINGDHPLVDAYVFFHNYIDIYISFCLLKTKNGWFIKSLHSDHSHEGNGDSVSIGNLVNFLGVKK